jgi:hypothetical protein
MSYHRVHGKPVRSFERYNSPSESGIGPSDAQGTSPTPQVTASPCVYLRSKAIYVTGQLDPDDPDESGCHYCWCNLTQRVTGPDEAPVTLAACTPGRSCYKSFRPPNLA